MRKLRVDSFDRSYVYCVDKEKNVFAIAKSEAPENLRKGDKLTIDDDGNITVDGAQTRT